MTDRKTVLFIDDNKDFLTLSEEELESQYYDFKFIHVNSYVEVLDEVKKIRPDIIFLDVLFSKNFSNSVATNIRKDSELSSVPIYLMSFLDLVEIEAIANKNEVNGCFMKPVKREDIATVFKKHFDIELPHEED